MTFSTLTFILYFLTPLLLVYYLVPKSVRNWLLLAVSILFCTAAGPVYMLIPVASVLINFFIGKILGVHRTVPVLAVGTAANTLLPLLFRLLLAPSDIQGIMPPVILFLGTCLCSLRAMTYLIDLFRGRTAVQTNPLKFALYMLFFPTFTAGPVIQYNEFRLALDNRKSYGSKLLIGVGYFVMGLLKKLIIADHLHPTWLAISSYDFTGLSLANAWLGFFALVLYVYFSLSGHWDMATGLCRMLGFDFSRRFHPVALIRKTGKAAWAYLFPLLSALGALLSAFRLDRIIYYIKAMLNTGYIGYGETDFMYRFTSERGFIILALICAVGLSFLRLIQIKPKKSRIADCAALTVIAALIAVSAINTVSTILQSSFKAPEAHIINGSYTAALENSIYEGSPFRERLFCLNNDIGYLLGRRGKNGVHYASDNALIERPAVYNEKAVDSFIEGVDYITDSERYETRLAVVPPAFKIMSDTLGPYTYDGRVTQVTERIDTLLAESSIHYTDLTDTMRSNRDKNLYYKTSTALSAEGTYIVYSALGAELGYKPYPMSDFDTEILSGPERFALCDRAGTDFQPYEYADILKYRYSSASETDSADGIVTYSSDSQSGRALALISDTYIPMIYEHFDIVYTISANKSPEDIKQFLNDKFITDVLVLCSTDTVNAERRNNEN